jgi:predicted nucleic acid-binding protein
MARRLNMKKLKIYLDTSVISHLDAPDTPEKMADTLKLWDEIKDGKYKAFISPVVFAEIGQYQEPKRSFLLNKLRAIPFTTLQESDEVSELAAQYVTSNVLRGKSFDDCQHIAYACVHSCDMIISWNFKHIVNYKTISGVKSVNAMSGYAEMLIYSPTILISGGTDDEL